MKSNSEFVDNKFKTLSDILEVEVKFSQDGNDQNLVHPVYDVNEMLSRLVGLFVLTGLHVPVSFAPSYNNVHANVEFWKESIKKQTEQNPES